MLPFTVELKIGTSVYEQLVYAVHRAIVSNQLSPGDRFPSIRTLSQELRINPNTAQKVVTRLADQGLLAVQPGIGTLVAKLPDPSPRERSDLLARQVEQLVVEARRLSLTRAELVRAVKDHWTRLSESSPPKGREQETSTEDHAE
ncbi:MAG: GntR family transcriptional regulator [Bryobacterales bacterium]|nr:GntR family transcriptional regulator [Bryobacterales bacterium]